jgi:hypothetical protein
VDARSRVRAFLLGRPADRAPFLPTLLDYASGISHAPREALLNDPHLLSSALGDLCQLAPFDGVLIALQPEEVTAVPGAAALPPAIETCREALSRLRALSGDRIGLGVLLPGPLSLAKLREADDVPGDAFEREISRTLELVQRLDPPVLDVVGVWERAALVGDDLHLLRTVLPPLWNTAGFYSMPSLFVAAGAGAPAGSIGASAVSVWRGALPAELAREGSARVGVPLGPDLTDLPEVRTEDFFVTAGELPPETDVDWLQSMAAEVALLG